MAKIDRIKAKRIRERKKLQEKQRLEDLRAEDVEEEEEDVILKEQEPPPDPETLEKMYDENGMEMPMPTSFEELDAMHEAQEKAEHVQEVTWSVSQLVHNILWDPQTDPKQKSAKIQKVASEFESRVADAMKPEMMQKDMDVLQIEAILAADARHTGIIEKGVDLLKEVLSTSARKKLSGEDFALPEKRKYPIHDKAHVRNALARAAQQIKEGGEGAADAKAALPKIRAAAKRMGIEVGMEKSAIIIEKDAKGDWRWIGIPTNNFIDWQNDIISKSAHEKYMAFLDANPDCAPAFLTWHMPGTARENPVDFWMEKDGAVIMSGILTEQEAAALLTVQKDVDLGMSLQAFAMRLDPEDSRVVTDYWMYEVSDLPADRAANPFTMLETMTKEVGMDKLDYLTKIMGSEERAKSFLEKTGQVQKELQAAGITSKENQDGAEKPAEEPTAAAAPASPPPVDVESIVKKITDELDFEGLNAFVAQAQEAMQKVDVLESLVKDLSKTKEEQLEEALTPPVSKFAWSTKNRPSQSDGTKLKKDQSEEDDALSDLQPGVPDDYWLSKATNTVPISAP